MRIFRIILPVRISGLLFSDFLITLLCYAIAVVAAYRSEATSFFTLDGGFLRLVLVAGSVVLGLFVNNMYADIKVLSRVLLILKLSNIVGIAFIVQGLLAYVSSGKSLPRFVMVVGSGITFVALLLWRMLYSDVLVKMIGSRKVLFIGRDSTLEEVARRIQEHPELGYSILGYLSDDGKKLSETDCAQGVSLGQIWDLESTAAHLRPDCIIVGHLERKAVLPVKLLLTLARRGVAIEEVGTIYESICGRVCSGALKPAQVIFHNEMGIRPGSVALQSIYTNLFALSAILLASPVLLIAAIAVKTTSRGPLFDIDVRVGQHGIPFNLNRFRCHTFEDFPRVHSLTKVGRIITALHFAALPQLFNLFRGEITLVGPRPERPEFVEEMGRYFAFYQQRQSVKPGMTGWSQIHLAKTPHNKTDSLCQLEYDLYYTKHISLALDAYILLHGIRRILPFARA